MISIITTSYNYSNYISETIKSVLAQTYSDWELIVVDDASSDNSVEIIKNFCSDKRIKLICHDKNKGLKKSIQTALKYAKGEWVAFLESDDTLEPNALEKRLNLASDNSKLIFNAVNLIGEETLINEIQPKVNKTEEFLSKLEFPCNMFKMFDDKNPILTLSSVIIKRELLTETLLNSPSDALLDWWIYINLAYKNNFLYINEKLTNWRIHANSYLKSPHRPRFCLVNAIAYINVYKQNPSFELLLLIIKCTVKMIFNRLKFHFLKLF